MADEEVQVTDADQAILDALDQPFKSACDFTVGRVGCERPAVWMLVIGCCRRVTSSCEPHRHDVEMWLRGGAICIDCSRQQNRYVRPQSWEWVPMNGRSGR